MEHFEKALSIDPKYSQAALYLGLRAYNSLFEQDKAQAALKKAIDIDPDYLEARVSYAGVLLDTGAVDEAIRQLNLVTQRNKIRTPWRCIRANPGVSHESQKIRKPSESARAAIKLTPQVAEPHMWLADSLRLSGKYQESTG